jgi:NAD dependent epimerase/dehydratase family enzyme
LTTIGGVHRAGLLGDHLHAITDRGAHTMESLRRALNERGFANAIVEETEPTLEDVFIELAGHDVTVK